MLTPALHQTQCGASVARAARVVKDKRVLKLIRTYLESGVMVNGVVMDTEEGTPQGGLCKALHNPPYVKKVIMQSNRQRHE
jgi:hypothetical protein